MSWPNARDLASHEFLNPEDPGGDQMLRHVTDPYTEEAHVPAERTQPEGTDSFAAYRLDFGQVPAQVLGDDTERRNATIRNTGTVDVCIGHRDAVDARSGFVLQVGKDLTPTSWREVYVAVQDRTSSIVGSVSVWSERNKT